MDYNKTINLPKTDFPMRAGLPKREPEMLKRWQEQDVYNELLKKNEGKPLFNLHDGPPFSNGGIHMGTAMNKALKDIITRSYAMRGYYTPYIPGWDNHGMPIESAIIKQNKLNHKAMSIPDFRSACHDFAQHYVGVQMDAFKRMGVIGDWEHPYLTMNPGFEAEEVKVFGAMYKKGYIYKDFKPVYWCPHDETALAEAEIEYQDDPCTTVYVKFPMHDDCGKLSGYDKLFFVIWTTTIWTLPGNLAIALHPEESYAVVKPEGRDELYIIFRATPQWFCSVESFKEQAVAACDDVRWVPGWGIDRMKSMIRERNDWCISRQRKWGLPIPVFYCKDCGKPICTDETIDAISKLFAAEGSNAWFAKEAEEILPEGFACPHCGAKAGFTKETDTLDGWFDSGSSHFAAMKKDQGFWPATMYLEGLDQYRGWFQSALLTAVGAFGQGAPFKECVTHGWTVDGEGRAMHKSLGNGMDPAEIINQYGADLLRLWAASADYHADVRCSHEIFKQLSQNYLKFRNTARYCLGNLDGFDADQLTAPAEMEELDRWAVTRLNALMEKCAKAYNDYEFLVVTHAVNDFCVVDMSNFYLDIIKDRLYCEEKDGAKRRSAQTALFLILDTMTKLMAPILCFTCDEIWLSMPHRSGDDGRNVVFNDMNKPFTDYALDETAMEKWSAVEKLRDDVNAVLEAARAEKKIGKALEAHVALHAGDDAASAALVQVMGLNLAELFIVSDCQVSSAEPDAASTVGQGANFPGLTVEVSEARGDKCERCWMHSPTVGADADHPTLCARCAAVVRKLPQF